MWHLLTYNCANYVNSNCCAVSYSNGNTELHALCITVQYSNSFRKSNGAADCLSVMPIRTSYG